MRCDNRLDLNVFSAKFSSAADPVWAVADKWMIDDVFVVSIIYCLLWLPVWNIPFLLLLSFSIKRQPEIWRFMGEHFASATSPVYLFASPSNEPRLEEPLMKHH